MDARVRILGSGDEAVLANVTGEVFDHPIDPRLAREFLADPRHHIAVAVDAGVVVGFASAVHYIHPDARPQLWINQVAVAPTHLRRGLGKALMEAILGEARRLACTEAWVLTDRSNHAAMALYVSAGGIEGADDDPGEGALGYRFRL